MSTLSQMGVAGVSPGILHPRLKHLFRTNFIGLGENLSTDQVKNLMMQTITTTLPNITWEEVPLHRYNATAYALGKHSFEPLSMTVGDDIGGLASHAIQSQMEKQQRVIGAQGAMYFPGAQTGTDYKFGMEIIQMDAAGTELSVWVCEGCQIMNADFGDRDWGSTGEEATIALQIRFDNAYYVNKITGATVGTALGGFLNN